MEGACLPACLSACSATLFWHGECQNTAEICPIGPSSGSVCRRSVGFTVGPAIGGWLSARSLQLAAWTATVGSAVSLVMILALLPGEY